MKYRNFDIVGLDFETFYSTHFTLNKIDTPLYVADPQFKIHGVGIENDYHITLGVRQALMNIDWDNTALLCYNTAFDAYILKYHFGIVPAYYLDALSMVRPIFQNVLKNIGLDSVSKHLGFAGKTSDILKRTKGKRTLSADEDIEMGDYCKQDVSETYKVFNYLLPFFPDDEMDLIDMTIRMFADPKFEADAPRISQEITRIEREREELFAQAKMVLPPTDEDVIKVLRSPDKFAQALTYNGIKSPTKVSPTTGKETHAFAKTDLEFKALGESDDPITRLLYKARLKSKSDNALNKAQKLLQYSELHTGIPAYLNYAKGVTLRWSGKELQMQNMTRGGEMRKSLIAPDGHMIAVCDSSQVEARTLAWFADQEDVLEVFASGKDIYKVMASDIYSKPIEKVTKGERFLGKCAILGLGYGMSAPTFQRTLKQGALGPPIDIELEECERIVNVYRSKNYRIRASWYVANNWLEIIAGKSGMSCPDYKGLHFEKGKVWLPNGMYLNYHDLEYNIEERSYTYQSTNGKRKYIYAQLFVENITQALARIIVAQQALEIQKTMPVVLLVHDEVITVVPEGFAEYATNWMEQTMKISPKWCKDLPLGAEAGYSLEYSK